ncbi:uncharacterized protein LOC127751598 [Frankliniella occidentalis]|uniref:Uncharacterized protein LOC127751598 n=1 Tax=Frankliniella occidentalis TaxID=133901 RepID=A0A9C6X930_FRAOC|nr:uncharacterized protein LOC127751598 [Frankliniella occidentalis]
MSPLNLNYITLTFLCSVGSLKMSEKLSSHYMCQNGSTPSCLSNHNKLCTLFVFFQNKNNFFLKKDFHFLFFRQRIWLKRSCNKELLKLSPQKLTSCFFCGDHFEPSSFTNKYRRRLLMYAYPTINPDKPQLDDADLDRFYAGVVEPVQHQDQELTVPESSEQVDDPASSPRQHRKLVYSLLFTPNVWIFFFLYSLFFFHKKIAGFALGSLSLLRVKAS